MLLTNWSKKTTTLWIFWQTLRSTFSIQRGGTWMERMLRNKSPLLFLKFGSSIWRQCAFTKNEPQILNRVNIWRTQPNRKHVWARKVGPKDKKRRTIWPKKCTILNRMRIYKKAWGILYQKDIFSVYWTSTRGGGDPSNPERHNRRTLNCW